MTAEIAILNTNAVALAADSAVTTNGGNGGEKVYHSVDKLFELSAYHPVGVMVYGRSNFLSAPWETLIKTYRNELKDKQFDRLEQYVDDFLRFVDKSEYGEMLAESEEKHFTINALYSEVKTIAQELAQLKRSVESELRNTHTKNEIKTKYFKDAEEFITEQLDILNEEYKVGFTDSDFNMLMEKYEKEIDSSINKSFEKSNAKETWREKIKSIACSKILKKSIHYSALVFSGFGEKELFPSVISVNIEGKINGKLKYTISTTLSKSVDGNNPAFIIPFAQRETVNSLMNGIDHQMEEILLMRLETMLKDAESKLFKEFKVQFKDDVNLEEVESVIHDKMIKTYREFNEDIYGLKQSKFVRPIIKTIESLPKKELAEMAETFINLTSFKRKASSTIENVGGPIDVAVITKGDGFQWIKRKEIFGK